MKVMMEFCLNWLQTEMAQYVMINGNQIPKFKRNCCELNAVIKPLLARKGTNLPED